MVKNYFGVSSHRKRVALLLRQQHVNGLVFYFVLLLRSEVEYFSNVHALAVVNVEAGNAATRRHVGHSVELHCSQPFN